MSNEITGKSLTYVEADVDLYRITQFEAVREGVAVAGWTPFRRCQHGAGRRAQCGAAVAGAGRG